MSSIGRPNTIIDCAQTEINTLAGIVLQFISYNIFYISDKKLSQIM